MCYTGSDTKLVKNSRKAPSKLSNLDRLVNRAIVMVLLILAVTVTICASASTGVNTKEVREATKIEFCTTTTKTTILIRFCSLAARRSLTRTRGISTTWRLRAPRPSFLEPLST